MFTLNHFVWLAIAVVVIVGMFLLTKYLKLTFNTVLTTLFFVCIASETVKIFSNMVETGYKGGMVLDPGDLPFHLCSIQIFFVFALKFFVKKETTKEKLLAFMAPTMLLGGIMALLIPTVGVKFTRPQVYQFFIFHAFIVFFSLYVLKSKLVRWSWKTLGRNLAYLCAMAFVVTLLNSMLSTGFEKVNFMYLVRPPMDNLPLLNLDNGWYAYFATLLAIVALLMTIFHAVMILITKKTSEKSAESTEATETAENE